MPLHPQTAGVGMLKSSIRQLSESNPG